MALSSAQKESIIYFLGWPSKTLVVNSTNYNKIVADRLENLSEDAVDRVGTILTNLDSIAAKFGASTGRMLVKKVGDIELNTDEHIGLNKEYRRLLRELSEYLDIPLMRKGGNMIGLVI